MLILENFLEPYLFNGQTIEPEFDIASFYGDQFPRGEMGREVARQYEIVAVIERSGKVCPSSTTNISPIAGIGQKR
jgi:hypothetical protein